MRSWREELAWAAGFFDGEGHVGAAQPSERRVDLYLSISQVDRRVLERFRAAVGCGHVAGPYLRSRVNERPVCFFQTQRFEHIQAIIAALWNFLSPVKRAQAVAALTTAKGRANHQATCRNGHPRTSENLRMVGPAKGWRACRECQRAKEHAYRLRKTAACLLVAI